MSHHFHNGTSMLHQSYCILFFEDCYVQCLIDLFHAVMSALQCHYTSLTYMKRRCLRFLFIIVVYDIFCRWSWNIPCIAQFLHSLHDVHLLWHCRPWSSVSEVSLVEKIHDKNANCECHLLTWIHVALKQRMS